MSAALNACIKGTGWLHRTRDAQIVFVPGHLCIHGCIRPRKRFGLLQGAADEQVTDGKVGNEGGRKGYDMDYDGGRRGCDEKVKLNERGICWKADRRE